MKVSRNWLQNFFSVPLPKAEEVAQALTFHAFEIDGIEKTEDDEVLDVKVTPNRGHDCLSHRGIAKELSAILRIPLNAEKDPFAKKPDLSKTTDAVTVSIEDPALCHRYIAAYVRGVRVGPSPEWLRASLEAIGQRSINNIVDATNLVMFNTGQPLHAFDATRLGSLSIGVRKARDGEKMEALDEKAYDLSSSMLVITAADRPVGIAGVKGGLADRIDESTKDVLLEAATFDGPTTRRTAARLKLRTDASARFEQVLSPELAPIGMQQCVDLIAALGGGSLEGFVDAYPSPQKAAPVAVSLQKVNAVLGTSLTSESVADALRRLGLSYSEKNGSLEVYPPPERLDLSIPEDLIEEVGRIIGYDKIPAVELPAIDRKPEVNARFNAAEKKREALMASGYSEVYTSVFAEKGERAVINKVGGERPYLRSTLVDNLREAYERNLHYKDLLGLDEVRIFEIGTVWKSGKELVMVGTADKSGVREEELGTDDADEYTELPVSSLARYKAFSKYPFIVRDVSLWVPNATVEDDVRAVLLDAAGDLVVRIDLFDRFEKGDRTSFAFRLVFQSPEKTLTDEDANRAMEEVQAALKSRGWEVR